MNKRATSDYPLHDIIAERWSPRAFSDKTVSDEDLGSILEAARWASSCFNAQPWSFIVTRKGEPAYDKALATLVEGNRSWAQNANVVIITVAEANFARNGKPNAHAWHDLGLAVGNLATQATHLGLALHQMAGFSADAARESFNIPEGHDPVTAIALGHPGSSDQLEGPLKEREEAERSRKPLKDFVFGEDWGKARF